MCSVYIYTQSNDADTFGIGEHFGLVVFEEEDCLLNLLHRLASKSLELFDNLHVLCYPLVIAGHFASTSHSSLSAGADKLCVFPQLSQLLLVELEFVLIGT